MADVNKEIALKVTTDTTQTVKAFQDAEQELGELKKQLVELAVAGKQGSAEFEQMSKRAGQLKTQIESVEQTVDGLAKSANRIEVFSGAMQGLAAGFAIAQGSAALFAEGNEELQESLVKVQASLALLQGTEQALQLLRRESAAGQALLTAKTAAYNLVVGTSTGALKLFRVALASTGIGLAVVAVGALVANFDAIKKAVLSFIETSAPLKAVIDFISRGFNRIGESLGILPSASEKATRQMIADLEKQKKLLEASGADTAAIDKRLAELRVQLAKQTGEGLAEAEEELTLTMAAQNKKRLDNQTEAAKKRLEIEKQTLEKIKEQRRKDAENQKEIDQIRIDFEAEKVQSAKDAAQKLAEIENDIRRSKLNDYQRQREDFLLQRQQMLELMRTAGASEIEQQMFVSNTNRMVQQMDAEKERQTVEQTEQKKFETRQQFIQKTSEMTMMALSALQSLYAASLGQSEKDQKKAFEANKKFSIAQALISTFLAVNNALTAGGNPIKLATGAQFVEASIALAAGLANVLKIRNTQFQSTSAPSPSAPSVPQLNGNIPAPTGNNQAPQITNLQGQVGQGQPQGQRIFVVERDITQVQSRLGRVQEFATF